MTTVEPGPASQAGAGGDVDQLECTLRALLQEHQHLLGFIEQKREAIRTADIQRITSICEQENTIVQRLTELEKRRIELVGLITERSEPEAKRPLPVAAIAETVNEPARTRLLALGEQLRSTMGEVRRASSVVRAAAEALDRHLAGIMHTVQSALSRARVYGSRGRLAAGAQTHFSVDLET